ncbi:hypothetical protein GCM10009535_57590 [Streptomyces thermocarboxydovorans]|uniref:Uncharacterized protein n=1 Tax=Streptomyces thermocarboxydovorans TaxID=59298 RepID=A0ABN1HW43_9ACTN
MLPLYDKPLYRDWAFWTTVGVAGMTAIAMGTSRDPTATSLPRWLDIDPKRFGFWVVGGV